MSTEDLLFWVQLLGYCDRVSLIFLVVGLVSGLMGTVFRLGKTGESTRWFPWILAGCVALVVLGAAYQLRAPTQDAVLAQYGDDRLAARLEEWRSVKRLVADHSHVDLTTSDKCDIIRRWDAGLLNPVMLRKESNGAD